MPDNLDSPAALSTSRLLLRKPRVEDASALFRAYANDPKVARFTSWCAHRDEDETREFLRCCLDEWSRGSDYHYLIEIEDASAGPVGMISFHVLDLRVSFGYVLAASHWGRGYMSEALAKLVDWSLQQPNVWRASAFCDAENHASARVMEKAGMTFEGILRRYFVHPNIAPEPRDCRMYARVRD